MPFGMEKLDVHFLVKFIFSMFAVFISSLLIGLSLYVVNKDSQKTKFCRAFAMLMRNLALPSVSPSHADIDQTNNRKIIGTTAHGQFPLFF